MRRSNNRTKAMRAAVLASMESREKKIQEEGKRQLSAKMSNPYDFSASAFSLHDLEFTQDPEDEDL